MPAMQNLSYTFSNIDAMVDELTRGVDAFGGGVGFLVCDASIDYPALVRRLSGAVAFPVVGCTTLAFPLFENRDEVSASLCVYSAPGLQVQVAVSEPLVLAQRDAQMAAVLGQSLAGHAEPPKLLYTCVPLMEKLDGEAFVEALFHQVGDVPVFGGMTSADAEADVAAVFANGECYPDRMLLMGMWGDIHPVFAVGSQITKMNDYAPKVTKSAGNVVYAVDDMTFYEYLARIGLVDAGSTDGIMDSLFKYGPLPVQITGKTPGEDLPEIRAIVSTDAETGSGTFSAAVPEGCRLNIGVLKRGDITESARGASDRLKTRVAAAQAPGRSYDLLLSLPCVARHFAQIGGPDDESALLRELVPPGTPVHGFYCFCEISPFTGSAGQLSNRTYNHSIVMCAI